MMIHDIEIVNEGQWFDPLNKQKEYRGWRKPKNFIKNLTSDSKNLMKRPKFDQETGDYEVLRPWLLNMAKTAKDMDRINYLRADANTAKVQLKKKAERIRAVQKGTPDRYTSVSTVERWIKKGCTAEKCEDHIKWLDTEYKKALNERAKEIRREYKNESSIFDGIEMI